MERERGQGGPAGWSRREGKEDQQEREIERARSRG